MEELRVQIPQQRKQKKKNEKKFLLADAKRPWGRFGW
jgi:hypothetical protein